MRVEQYLRDRLTKITGTKYVPRLHTQVFPCGLVIVEVDGDSNELVFGFSLFHPLDQFLFSKKSARAWAEEMLERGELRVSNNLSEDDLNEWMKQEQHIPDRCRYMVLHMISRLRDRITFNETQQAVG